MVNFCLCHFLEILTCGSSILKGIKPSALQASRRMSYTHTRPTGGNRTKSSHRIAVLQAYVIHAPGRWEGADQDQVIVLQSSRRIHTHHTRPAGGNRTGSFHRLAVPHAYVIHTAGQREGTEQDQVIVMQSSGRMSYTHQACGREPNKIKSSSRNPLCVCHTHTMQWHERT